jgi:hypothetical protein
MEFLAQSKGMTVDELKDSLTPKNKRSAPEMENLVSSLKNWKYNDFKKLKRLSAESRRIKKLSKIDLSTS